jgi:sugar/nucleoside kinase (ribokinase family)
LANVLVVGHVVRDRTPTGYTVGGAAAYGATLARKLRHQVTLVSRHGPELRYSPPFALCNQGSATTTTFENTYDGAGSRSQRISQPAAAIDPRPVAGIPADILFAATVWHEAGPEVLRSSSAPLKGIGLQGWFRAADSDGRISQTLPSTEMLSDVGASADAAFLSREDLPPGHDHDCLEPLTAGRAMVVLTDGANGADLHAGGKTAHIDAFPANQVEPTGAGDVFAMSFLIALHEGRGELDALRFAAAAAAVHVEGVGLDGVPDRPQIEERLARHPEVQVRWRP